jgi:nucleoside-diphosphate-sugar epimerase
MVPGDLMAYEKILVTGAAGLLGQAVVAELLDRCKVSGFDRTEGTTDIPWHVGDICDPAAIRKAVEGQEAVIHLAAMAHVRAGTPDQIMQVNTMGTWQCLSASEEAGVRRVVICSSDSVIGFTVRQGAMIPPDYLPIDEGHPARATDPYGISKQLGEELARAFFYRGKLSVVVMRPVFILYPSIEGETRRRAEDPVNYRGPDAPDAAAPGGGVVWHHIDPRDAALGFRLAVEHPSLRYDTFFLSAATTLAPDPTLDRLRQHLGGRLPEIRKPEVYRRNGFAPLYDMERARDVLGYEPRYNARSIVEDIFLRVKA